MKKLLLILLYFPIIGFAQETGCVHGDCENGQGTYVDDYGETYIGQWKNGKKHGEGIYTFPDWDIFEKYIGEYCNGKKHGKGTLTHRYNYADEKKGYWENGDYIGEIKKPTTECVTLGCFSGNCENGNGSYLFADGDNIKYSCINLFKTYDSLTTCHDESSFGDKYEGQWKNGMFHGKGQYTWINGDKYVGQYIDGRIKGKGEYTWINGDKYVGEFINGWDSKGFKNGKGTKTYSNGVIEEGEWRDDVFIKLYPLDASIPESYSLEKYCPKVINQGQNPFCVTYSISTIATIIYAKENGITDQLKISENRFSPTFLHYIFPESVDPRMFSDIGKYISHYGLPFMKDFEGNEFDGNLYKGQSFYSENVQELINIMRIGSKYTIGACRCSNCKGVVDGIDYGSFHSANEFKGCHMYAAEGHYVVDRNKIKEQIFLGNPCWYGDDFNDLISSYKNGYINMDREINSDTSDLHALVIIGYDDNKYGGSFRILNSWGENWGENGKGWIRYEDIDTIKGSIRSYGKGNQYNKELSDIEIKKYFTNLDNKPAFKNKSSFTQIELDTVKAISNCRKFLSSGFKPNVQLGDDNDLLCKCFVKKLKNLHNISPISSIDIGEVTNIMTIPFDPYDSDPSPIADTEYKIWGEVIWDCWHEYMDNLD